MATNHGKLCRDLIGGALRIKDQTVLDADSNLRVKGARIRGDARVKGDLTVDGKILSGGSPTYIMAVPYTIDTPGNYALCQSLTLAAGECAITIDADDVNLSLGGHVLAGRGSNQPLDPTTGIKVLDGHQNICIGNGTIRGFSNHGILAIGFDKLQVKYLCLIDNGSELKQADNHLLVGGMRLDSGVGGVSTNVELLNITALHNYFTGVYAHGIHNLVCLDSNFSYSKTLFGIFGGFFDVAFGFANISFFTAPFSENWRFERCKFNNCVGLPGPDATTLGAGAHGLDLFGSLLKDLVLIDCEANNNAGDSWEAEGYGLFSSGPIFMQRCVANSNKMLNTSGVAKGIIVGGSRNIQMIDCQASQNTGGEKGCFGIQIFAGSQNVKVENCLCSENSNEYGDTFGISTRAIPGDNSSQSQSVQIINCQTTNNTATGNTAVGILMDNVETGCVISCKAGQNTTNGILVSDEIGPTGNILVKENAVINNGSFGIEDTTSATTNLYLENVGISNPFDFGSGVDMSNINV